VQSLISRMNSSAMVVVEHGRIVYSYGDLTAQSYLASVRKSILSMLYGIEIARGHIDTSKTLATLGLDDLGGLLPREKEATISQLSATLPSESQVAGGDEAALETELAELDEAQNSEMARIDNKLGGMKASHDAEIDALRSEIARLQHDIATRVAAFAETQGRASQQRSISTAKWRESRQPIALRSWISARPIAPA